MNYDKIIKEHYRKQAKNHGESKLSTMEDEFTREKETQAILSTIDFLLSKNILPKIIKILEVGCGNGYLMSILSSKYCGESFYAIEYCDELLNIARKRNLNNVKFFQGNCKNLKFKNEFFDIVITERVIINLLSNEDQMLCIREIHRVLKRGGFYIMIESFKEPLQSLNEARKELCLEEISQPYHNLYIDDIVFNFIRSIGFEDYTKLSSVESNFLSNHYFISRVFHELVRPQGGRVRNTHFVKFFDKIIYDTSQNVKDYSPIKYYLLKKNTK